MSHLPPIMPRDTGFWVVGKVVVRGQGCYRSKVVLVVVTRRTKRLAFGTTAWWTRGNPHSSKTRGRALPVKHSDVQNPVASG